MAKSNIGLVQFAATKLNTPYVYGTKGELMTESKYNMLKKMYPAQVWDSDRSKVGKVCVDCSGLISWYTGIAKSSTQFKTEVPAYPIDTISKAPAGAAVWRPGHIGIYIGGGEIIEARGSNYGTVKTKVAQRDFTHWLYLKDIEYEKQAGSDTKYFNRYTGKQTSIAPALVEMKQDSSFEQRRRIAFQNKIVSSLEEYKGTVAQNTEMLKLLKLGKLIKS